MNPQQVIADLARIEDTDAILELNKREYGPRDILVSRADFAWRHDRNPAGQAIIPVIRDDQDNVVGFIWLVPLRLRIKGQDRLAATGANLVIHPGYRNTFGYTKLIRRFEQVIRDRDIPLHLSFVSGRKYRELRQHAPQTALTVPLLIRPLTPWRPGGRRLGSVEKEITIKTGVQFDSSFDQFWPRVQDKHPVMAVRTSAFLAWRFENISGRTYHVLAAQADDQMAGYAVLRCTTVRGVNIGLVMDLLVRGDDLGEAAGARLMCEAEAFFRVHRVWFAVGLMVPFAAEYRILRQAGYAHLPAALALRPFRFAFIIHNRHEQDLATLSAQDWFVTLADYESF